MIRALVTADTVGGVWTYAADLCRLLPGFGIEPVLVTLGPRPSATQRAMIEGALVETDLPLEWLADTGAAVRAAGRTLARLARDLGADVVQLNSPALAAGAPFDMPVLAVAHSCVCTWWYAVRSGPMPDDLAWRATLTGDGLRAATRTLAPSAAFAQALVTCHGLSRPPAVVHNGRRRWPVRAGGPVAAAFTAGRLWDDGKNIATLDRAAALTRVPIRAAGPLSGPHGATVSLRAIQSLGQLGEAGVAAQLANRPVFVSTALYEPFGLAVLEAAQAECPLVLADIPTFRELWDGAARFVYPHDAAGFARAIDEVVADPELRARLAAAARTRAARFTAEAMTAGVAAHLVDLARLIPATARMLEAAE